MSAQRISASQFKARCLALLDEVAATGEDLVVTKRGRAVARVTAVATPVGLQGSVVFNVSEEQLVEPLDVEWAATGA